MHLLTPAVVRDLRKIADDYSGVVAAVVFGEDAVSADSYKLAVDLGMIDPTDPQPGLAQLLHMFGSYVATVGDKAKHVTLDQFRALIKKDRLPRTEEEERSSAHTALRGAQHMTNAGARLSGRVVEKVAAEDAAGYTDLRSAVKDAISARFGDSDAQERVSGAATDEKGFFGGMFRATVKRITSDIGHLTSEWKRDLQRIVQTETTAAVQQGQKDRWLQAEEDDARHQGRPVRDVLVYKLPRPGHCRHCGTLHLDNGVPRVFTLSHLQGNGTNVGKRAADWNAVVGTTHPWCQCILLRLPAFVVLSSFWVSGEADPTVVGPGGRLA